ncbi:MAG: response regulator, partial [Cyanobacteria bacterium P01_F01_bin.4]
DNWVKQVSVSNGQPIIGYEGSPRHLLIVDDRWENRSVLRELLTPLGFHITEAETGQAALTQARQTPLDLIVSDIMMPVMDGFEMLKQLRNDDALKHLAVIVSSASVSDMDRQMSLEVGGDDFLPKPIDAEELLSLLTKHLQLTWKYDDTETKPSAIHREEEERSLVIPPVEDLQLLFGLAQDGLLIKLAKMADDIGQKNHCYLPFTQEISHLAKQFDAEKIETLLQKYLTPDPLTGSGQAPNP